MNPEADPELVIQAAQIAGVHDLILQLPNGYDTEIGTDGTMLSGGQRQRIGLARAFFGDPRLLVLDEPNSNLDTVGEEALATAIEVAKGKNITCVLISHKPNILNTADLIMIMQDGMIATYGGKKEILDKMNQLKPVSAV
jgi:ABC-type protease/lipase transport system fused ATPase/permease subunit